MSEDVGGRPFEDGEEPESHHAAADEEFATVVFDEDFVRSAAVHEPTAAERILAAAQSHSEAEATRGFEDAYGYGAGHEGEFDPDAEAEADADAEELEEQADEGRFDRSNYAEYAEYAEYTGPSDDDDFVPYAPYVPHNAFGQHGPYGPHSSYAAYAAHIDSAEEHGSDHGYRHRGAHAARGTASRRYRGHVRWQRPIAWVLAVIMGIGMVALALSAVYRGTSGSRQEPTPPPASTGVDSGRDHSAHARRGAQQDASAPPRGEHGAPPSLKAPVSAAATAGDGNGRVTGDPAPEAQHHH